MNINKIIHYKIKSDDNKTVTITYEMDNGESVSVVLSIEDFMKYSKDVEKVRVILGQ